MSPREARAPGKAVNPQEGAARATPVTPATRRAVAAARVAAVAGPPAEPASRSIGTTAPGATSVVTSSSRTVASTAPACAATSPRARAAGNVSEPRTAPGAWSVRRTTSASVARVTNSARAARPARSASTSPAARVAGLAIPPTTQAAPRGKSARWTSSAALPEAELLLELPTAPLARRCAAQVPSRSPSGRSDPSSVRGRSSDRGRAGARLPGRRTPGDSDNP